MVIVAYGVDDHKTYSEPECIGPFPDNAAAEAYIVAHDLRSDPKIKVAIWPLLEPQGDGFTLSSVERAIADFAAGRGTVRAKGERP